MLRRWAPLPRRSILEPPYHQPKPLKTFSSWTLHGLTKPTRSCHLYALNELVKTTSIIHALYQASPKIAYQPQGVWIQLGLLKNLMIMSTFNHFGRWMKFSKKRRRGLMSRYGEKRTWGESNRGSWANESGILGGRSEEVNMADGHTIQSSCAVVRLRRPGSH